MVYTLGLFKFKYVVCFNSSPISMFHDMKEAEEYMKNNPIANRIIELKEDDD